jgi:hypothetical protein
MEERFNGITHTNTNLAAFREIIPKERLKELQKTPLEKPLSIYAYSSELTKEEVGDIYSGDENRIYREMYEELEIFNWPITRRNAYKRLESFRLAIKAELKQHYNVGSNEGAEERESKDSENIMEEDVGMDAGSNLEKC